MLAPEIASTIKIKSYKHNGQLHRIWENNFVLKGTKTIVIGANDKTKVIEADGRSWITREPAIFYFHSHYWFNIISMMKEDGIHYYCNLSSPFVYDQEALKYIDYDLDVKVYPDMTYQLLDKEEYEEHKKLMKYPHAIEAILNTHMDHLFRWIYQRKGPFSPEFVDTWYERFLTYR